MPHSIRITVGEQSFAAELNDTPTAAAILEVLPLEASGSRWGEEIYFGVPVERDAEPEARANFDVGELGYWPPGTAFCIFFGPTPASPADGTPTMANPGTPIGRILDDVSPLRDLPGGATVRVEAA